MARLAIRCSEKEKAAWEAMAKEAGLTVSELVREKMGADSSAPTVTMNGQPAETFTQLKAKLPKPAPRKPGSMCRRCTTIGKPSCPECKAEANKASASATEVFSHLEHA